MVAQGEVMQNQSVTTDIAVLGPHVEVTRAEIIRIAVLGALAGVLIPLIANLVATYFIDPVFCRTNPSDSICNSAGVIAYHSAAIVVAFAAVALLANWGVYRALLLVIVVTIAMWGLRKYADPLASASLLEFTGFSVLLHALSYVLFYWLLRFRNFPFSLIVAAVAVVVICWALVA